NRKVLGGGMRQAGVLAAAGIVAIEAMSARLSEDHDNAGRLARGLSDLPGIRLAPASVKTNIVYVNFTSPAPPAAEVVARLGEKDVRVLATGPDQIRAVTHYGISEDDIERALTAFTEVIKA
nr:threonine aldolase [Desulfobacterales bacterium]